METEEDLDSERKSKTQRKIEMTALQTLGVELTTYKKTKLDRLDLPDNLRTAIDEYNRLPNSHGARKRQAQYIGRLMRVCDHETIRHAISNLETTGQNLPKQPSLWKAWSEKLLEQGDTAISSLILVNPRIERQQLRQLYREYQKADGKAKLHFKHRLEDYLKQYISS